MNIPVYIEGNCRALEDIVGFSTPLPQKNNATTKGRNVFGDMGEVNVGTELIFRATVIVPLPKACEKTVGNTIKQISHAYWCY